jgi:bifunctional UDP-N-acetylglucosamine pyrophosphorylase/glucosamine-1-phosphate N-acetyltransferase
MLRHLVLAAEAVFDRLIIVLGPNMPELEAMAAPHRIVIQQERLGTAHAALQAVPCFEPGQTAIFYADNPLVSAETMRALLASVTPLTLLATTPPSPGAYGRLVTANGYVTKIVEAADATAEEKAITLCNAGGLKAGSEDLARWLAGVTPNNAKREYYLTDIVGIAAAGGAKIACVEAPFSECMGINSRAELRLAEAACQARLREAALESGVSMQAPETVFFSADTELGQDISIGPYVVLGPGVKIDSRAEIRAFSHLEQCHVGEAAIIGPYARLRPGAEIGAGAHVGNFVEIKAARLGPGAKANHLSYIGDAEIGEQTNIGAGTITCNYDGKTKHKTKIGKRAFIGSNTALVAPISIGDDALIAAGSTLTENVPENTLALARARQINKPRK